jgi:nitrite reductase (cytochrome c-552)
MNDQKSSRRRFILLGVVTIVSAAALILVAGLLVTIFTHKQEARQPFVRLVEVDENTTDPAVWGTNWPYEYETYKRTVDYQRTRYGGSDAIPRQKLDADPWLKKMWSGYAFSLDYREARGHAYMLIDQQETERVKQKPQPGACLHCHASVIPTYRYIGKGDVEAGFVKVSAMPYQEARNLRDDKGAELIQHPASCVDCHDPKSMAIRVTRPAFMEGIRNLKAHQGVKDYDVNRDATRQEMRAYVCAQCHVEYYFKGEGKRVTYPWAKGIKVGEIESYYDEAKFSDWTHGVTGAPVLKAQHPEFETWSQGTHAKAGVVCADCHMPYMRQGAMKVSNHHVRSPLLNIAASCQTCHKVTEQELLQRANGIQDTTRVLIDKAAVAVEQMIDTIGKAKAHGLTDEQLKEALALQRRAQWRLDFTYSENSMGFHAAQETARNLAEAIDYAQKARIAVLTAISKDLPDEFKEKPVEGVTPADKAPPAPPAQ